MGDLLIVISIIVVFVLFFIEDLCIVGDLKEGNKVVVSVFFMGGIEGVS